MSVYYIIFSFVGHKTADNFAEILPIFVILTIQNVFVLLHFVLIFVHNGTATLFQYTEQVIVVKDKVDSCDLHPVGLGRWPQWKSFGIGTHMSIQFIEVIDDVCFELISTWLFAIGFIVIAVKLLELLLANWEEHCVVHCLHMILDIATGKLVRATLDDIDKENNHSDANKFYDDNFAGIYHLVMQLLLGLLALELEENTWFGRQACIYFLCITFARYKLIKVLDHTAILAFAFFFENWVYALIALVKEILSTNIALRLSTFILVLSFCRHTKINEIGKHASLALELSNVLASVCHWLQETLRAWESHVAKG